MRIRFDIKSFMRPSRRRMVTIGLGVFICVASLVFTNQMAETLREKERSEVMTWALAMGRLGNFDRTDPLVEHIVSSNNTIPFIVTDKNLRLIDSHLIPHRILDNPDLLRKQLEQFAAVHQHIEIRTLSGIIYIFYGESTLLKKLVYFPFIQLMVFATFIFFGFVAFHTTRHGQQNSVWVGLAKETAHQLGTPISSLLGWVEYLRSQSIDQTVVDEMSKDVSRLMTVTDRFSKIGSDTPLSEANVNEVVGNSVQYFQSRIPKNIALHYNGFAIAPVKAMINVSLFEWVIENLLKNAVDAMRGKGELNVTITPKENTIIIDVSDTGKGIPKSNFTRIFDPGFSTKTRGWGLGLSLSKRVVEEYHNGKIFVESSEVDEGTNMRIILKRVY